MIDHLTGDHPEFWDPEKLLRVRRDTGLIEAAVTATIRLPVVNSGFLDFGNRVAFTATARATVADATGGALVEVEHSGQFIDAAEPWNGRTTVRGGLRDDQWVDLAVVFDTARKTFRSEIYPEYKAQRPPPPDDLIPQFALIREATDAFNLPRIEMEGYEADDIIATYAKQAVESGHEVTIVSSDKDLMQLVGDGVEMLDAMKNKTIDRAADWKAS